MSCASIILTLTSFVTILTTGDTIYVYIVALHIHPLPATKECPPWHDFDGFIDADTERRRLALLISDGGSIKATARECKQTRCVSMCVRMCVSIQHDT